MTEPEMLRDPLAMDEEEFATVPEPSPADPSVGSAVVVEDEYAPGLDQPLGGARTGTCRLARITRAAGSNATSAQRDRRGERSADRLAWRPARRVSRSALGHLPAR